MTHYAGPLAYSPSSTYRMLKCRLTKLLVQFHHRPFLLLAANRRLMHRADHFWRVTTHITWQVADLSYRYLTL